jgi:hypothetical protein
VKPESGGTLVMRVAVPPKCNPAKLVTWAGRGRVRHARPIHGIVAFRLPTKPGRAADWAVTAGR